jgi:acyl dehydratase
MNFNGEPVSVGRDYGGRELAIDRELLDHYIASVEADPALYRELVPALLLHSECYRDLNWYLANIFGNLHARQEWEMFAPVSIGERVATRAFIRDRYRKRGRDYVVKETWTTAPDGRLLCRGLTHQSFLVETAGSGDVVDKGREKSKERVFDIGGHGRPLEPLTRTVHENMCRLFSGPGDNYHTDRTAARALGFPDIVVQGMLPICFVSELLTRDFHEGWLAGGKMDVRLVNVLWAGERVSAHADIRDEVPEAGRTRMHLDVWVEKDDGTKVIVGQASALR